MRELVKMSSGTVELDGYLNIPQNCKTVYIHFHGLAGNFYESGMVRALEEHLSEADVGFMSVNTRGHDYLADAVFEGPQWLLRGGAHTKHQEYVEDILSWQSWAGARYSRPLVLGAHSASAAALAHSLGDCIGAVYISPADVREELRASVDEERYEELVEHSVHMISEGRASSLMPDDALPGYLLDAECYHEMSLESSPWSIFSWTTPENATDALRTRPSLITFGAGETPGPLGASQLLNRWSNVSRDVRTAIVSQADHSYRGREADLALLVRDFALSLQ